MTTEVAILNREAIALAADSAVTIRIGEKTKILPSANKIFTLTKYYPIGIMVYGNSLFMGLPWESIIKMYRKQINRKRFDYVEDYCKDFINWLTANCNIFPEKVKNNYIKDNIKGIYDLILNDIIEEIKYLTEEKVDVTEEDIIGIISRVIKEYYKIYKEANKTEIETKDNLSNFRQAYKNDVIDIKKRVFQKLPINSALSRMLTYIAEYNFFRVPFNIHKSNYTGLVIAGFGEKELFPSIFNIHIEGIVVNEIKYILSENQGVSFENEASVIGYAQGDMVYTFMEGIDKDYYKELKYEVFQLLNGYTNTLVDILSNDENKKIKIKQVIKKKVNYLFKCKFELLDEMRRDRYVMPIVNTISILPKSELPTIAESLVHLTSLKRKMSFNDESVGGPIDVAVISKGDGFIWIKRKHYFEPDLNVNFFNNYSVSEVDQNESEE